MDQLDSVRVVHMVRPRRSERLTKKDRWDDVQGLGTGAHLVVSRRTGRFLA
jgi:hypothetical protein